MASVPEVPEPETFAEGLTPEQLAPGQEPYVDPEPEPRVIERPNPTCGERWDVV